MAGRAYKYLKRICKGRDRRAAIQGILDSIGVQVYVQDNHNGAAVNLEVRFGKDPHRMILAGHYDRVDVGRGANDNGAAVAQLLALVWRLHRERYQGDLTVVIFDQEELLGYGRAAEMGSTYYGDWLAEEGIQPEIFLVLDVTGRGDQLVISDSADLDFDPDFNHMANFVEISAKGDGIPLHYLGTPPSDDYGLSMSGIPSLLLTVLPKAELKGRRKTWDMIHSTHDNLGMIDRHTMEWMPEFLYTLCVRGIPLKIPNALDSGRRGRRWEDVDLDWASDSADFRESWEEYLEDPIRS